jgi:hypothetical protein
MSSTVWCASMCRSPFARDAEIHHAVAGNLVEHVLEEWQARVEIGAAAAVEAHRNADLRLQRVAADRCTALCHGVFHAPKGAAL